MIENVSKLIRFHWKCVGFLVRKARALGVPKAQELHDWLQEEPERSEGTTGEG